MKTAQELAQQADDFRKIVDAYLPKPSPMIKISPDHTLIGHEVMWGGIWRVPGLDGAGWYRGWPHVEDALIVAKEVFAERGV